MKHGAHAGHEDGATSPLGMRIGATMTILGAVLALFTVTGNAARTELLGIYTQETIAALHAETSAMKYRVLETQLRQLHSLSPGRAEVKSAEVELAAIAAGSPEAARATEIARLAVRPVISGLTPAKEDIAHFAWLTRGYRAERDAAMTWVRTFEGPKRVLTAAIEHYEWAELCAELGVVASSLALLLASRRIWLATVALGLAGMVVFAGAFFPTRAQMHAAEAGIEEAQRATERSGEASEREEAEEDEQAARAGQGD